jgi:hypothetical protein
LCFGQHRKYVALAKSSSTMIDNPTPTTIYPNVGSSTFIKQRFSPSSRLGIKAKIIPTMNEYSNGRGKAD